MQKIQNDKIKESVYIETLDNGMKIIIIPKPNTNKKYIIWGTKFGSIDNHFIEPKTGKVVKVPDGVAHYLEHKMFEQENGVDSLYKLMSLGLDANAYTTNDHTAYLFGGTNNFYEGLDELMDYVQHPYFTDQNVEKEKGIIGQEIMMYDDYPEWVVYQNALNAMYYNNPVKLDVTGTIETINKIDKEILYKCYNTFYNPSNMAMVICGDFEPEKILQEVQKRLIKKESNGEIKRIYPEEPENIVQEKIEKKMDVSMPLFVIGIKDKEPEQAERVKKHITIEILLNIIIGQSSNLYKELYNSGQMYSVPSLDYEFAKNYAHILITGQAKNPEQILEKFQKEVEKIKQNGINEQDFNRYKKMIYGSYVKEYDEVGSICRMFLADFFKGINSFDYIEEINTINIDYAKQILEEVFKKENTIISIIS